MTIIETCPVCGHDLIDSVICTNPPIPKKECAHCGWSWEEEREEVIRIPFNPNKKPNVTTIRNHPLQPSDKQYDSSPCVHCSNNPRNGGSGICHCTLGLQTIYC